MARRRRRIIATDALDRSAAQANSARGRVIELWEAAKQSRNTARDRQSFHDGDLRPDEMPTVPRKAPEDIIKIQETVLTPNAKAIVDQLSQQLRVSGIRMEDSDQNSPAWSNLWMRNRMGSKQVSLHKAMFTQGLAYGIVLPARGRLDNAKTAAFQLRSAKRVSAFYRDDFDEWPEFALDYDTVTNADGEKECFLRFYDEAYVHYLSCPEGDESKMVYISNERHDMGVTPVQRFGYVDLDGNAFGEVEPYKPLLQRIDQDTSDRLVLQRFASWMIRFATGVTQPDSPEAKAAVEAWLSVGDLLMNESPDAKFGVLQASPMDGHIRSREADVKDLAAVSQVPSYRMLGLADNIGAEAIAAADASLKRKMDEYKEIVGEQYESMIRLGGYASGQPEIANDFTSRIVWAKTDAVDIASLSSSIATLFADGQGIPMEMMWERLDGWTQQDTQEAKRIRQAFLDAKQAQELLTAAVAGEGQETSSGNGNGNQARASAPSGASSAG